MNVIEREMQELKEIIENGSIKLLKEERVEENIIEEGYWKVEEGEKEIEKRFENNMKAVLEIEKKQAVKEFAEKCMDGVGYGSDERIIKNYLDEFMKEYEK